MDPVLERLERIEAMLQRALNKPLEPIITVHEALPLTGCGSIQAQYRWFKRYGIAAYSKGKYVRLDITNKVARLALAASRKKPKTQ